MKAWRDVCVPHPDVLEGSFQQSEFAADISAVRDGKATREYQQASAFFERTYVTEGMRLLLTQVAQRLCGLGGEPVIQLQTAFGGGKTHTMLAVYHLATRTCSLKDLAGIPSLLDRVGLLDVPKAKVAVLDGTKHAPGQPWKHGGIEIRTLWGELAWQLGGEDGYARVRQADKSGTSPGKEVLRELFTQHSPCVVLIDELLAYIRQFPEGQVLTGGSYDSNLSFIQALTEAVKLSPAAVMLASLPESDVEAGSERAVGAMKALQKTFGRVQALWKPVAAEEAFEIVRRRLFEPIVDTRARDEVCQAFLKLYAEEGTKLPSETHEARYLDRLVQAYPIHPEVFDRLYEDWSTLERFQRTRGVLKLMAHVIYCLWKGENRDWMIMPGSMPLDKHGPRDVLLDYLEPGWDAVLETDIDGARAETVELDGKEARFGAVMASRRVSRAVFLGSAPSSVPGHKGIRGVDRARVMLGCVQPGQPSSVFSDALNRLCDRLHYLNTSGDKDLSQTRYWFDTRPNLRREMEDRRGRFREEGEVRGKIADVLRGMVGKLSLFDGVHFFVGHGDIPDDDGLRLVFLEPEKTYSRREPGLAEGAVLELLANNGVRPRYRANRLICMGADEQTKPRLMEYARTVLSWASIIEDIEHKRLNVDRLQEEQAKKARETAEKVLMNVVKECYRWMLCPSKASPTSRETQVEAHLVPVGSNPYAHEIEKVCTENMLVISGWSPVHLRMILKQFYWTSEKAEVKVSDLWADMQKFLYLPRLRRQNVLSMAVLEGAKSRDFFGIAQNKEGDKYEGFEFGRGSVQFHDGLLLIEPGVAGTYEERVRPTPVPPTPPSSGKKGKGVEMEPVVAKTPEPPPPGLVGTTYKTFVGSVDVGAASAKIALVQIADEVIAMLSGDPNATVRVTLEIQAEFPKGAPDTIRRAVSENAGALGFKNKQWE